MLSATSSLLSGFLLCLLFPALLFLLFNPPPPPEIYTLSLHDALPIFAESTAPDTSSCRWTRLSPWRPSISAAGRDRKSTRLNSSHLVISYAVFCLKKKIKNVIHVLGRIDSNKLLTIHSS